jgi:hypothetical protein
MPSGAAAPCRLTGAMPSRPQPRPIEGIDHVTCRHCGSEFQTISWSHLVFRHHYASDRHAIQKYMARFRLARAESLRLYRKRRRKTVAYLQRIGRRWSDARVKREIRLRHLNHRALNFSAAAREDSALLAAAATRMGSWRAAVEASGIPYEQASKNRRWSRDRIVATLKSWRRAGRRVNYHAVVTADPGFHDAACSHFGSYAAALRAAAIDPDAVRRQEVWTRDRVLRELRREGPDARRPDVRKRRPKLVCAAQRHFGGWHAARKAAGYEYLHGATRWSNESVLDAIRGKARRKLSLRTADVRRDQPGLVDAAIVRFGRWRDAVKTAGCARALPEIPNWTSERVQKAIVSLHRGGQPMDHKTVRQRHPSLIGGANHRFGSWRRAVEACGLDYEAVSGRVSWTRERIKRGILDLTKRRQPVTPAFVNRHHKSMYEAARRQFGSWKTAVETAARLG